MPPSLRSILMLALASGVLSGCGDEPGTTGSAGDSGVGMGVAGMGGVGGMGGAAPRTCGPDAVCETQGFFCDIRAEACVECLSTADCMDESEVCTNGTCQPRLCMDDADCMDAETPQCTESGCKACEGEVVMDEREGDCFAARGPNGSSPRDSDGCSADQFLTALENAGYDIPSDGNARQAIKDNPVKHVTEGLCSVPFGNAGDPVSACELHDFCYSVCGSSRARCDLEFSTRLLTTCSASYPAGPCLTACNAVAVIYAGAVAAASDAPYLNDQRIYCTCCPDTTSDGTCNVDEGESVDNSRDCRGDFSNGTSCITNNDCESGYCSVHGECAPLLCLTNGDCPSEICNAGLCLARGLEEGSNCTSDAACASNACTLGVCLECQNDDACGAGKHCNLIGNCIDDLGNNAVCTANGECRSNICSAGFCAECVRDSQCNADEHCNLVGDCVNDLGNNAVCTANGECRSNICSAGFCAECVRDSQCDADEHCNVVGDCIDDLRNGSVCTANAECRSGRCFGLVCVGF